MPPSNWLACNIAGLLPPQVCNACSDVNINTNICQINKQSAPVWIINIDAGYYPIIKLYEKLEPGHHFNVVLMFNITLLGKNPIQLLVKLDGNATRLCSRGTQLETLSEL